MPTGEGDMLEMPRLQICTLVMLLAVGRAAAHAAPAADTDAAAVVSGSAGARLDAYFEALEAAGFSGTVLVARKGDVLLHKGYGLADRRRKAPCTTETVHDIGSITKQFTAAAILKLEMAGKLRVEDPLARYLEGVPEDKAGVTLHHLLTHTSGLDHYYGEDEDYAPRDLAVRLFLRMPLITTPGAKYRYSNPGFSLLAAVVEKVSGKPYEAYLREVFFEPAGMAKTGYLIPRWNVLEVSKNYNGDRDNGWTFNRNWGPEGPYWHLFGNGGILTTTGDLYKWEQALMSDRLLSPEAHRKLLMPHVKEDEDGRSFYGYGWRVGKTDSGTAFSGHGGGSDFGVAAAHFRFPEAGVLVIVLSNQASFPGGANAATLTERISRLALAP
jgi:CubicO group peptidase (beta-lactamase class C family)